MAKTRGAYPPEFRRQMVELVHAGRTPEALAHEFERNRCGHSTLATRPA
jgi:transposase